jgi:hypothetical protein
MDALTRRRANFEVAASNPEGIALRKQVCRGLATSLAGLGQTLWVGGYLVGPDRAAGRSPFAFGSDATDGFATVIQIGGQLMAGAITLLEDDNLYATRSSTLRGHSLKTMMRRQRGFDRRGRSVSTFGSRDNCVSALAAAFARPTTVATATAAVIQRPTRSDFYRTTAAANRPRGGGST